MSIYAAATLDLGNKFLDMHGIPSKGIFCRLPPKDVGYHRRPSVRFFEFGCRAIGQRDANLNLE